MPRFQAAKHHQGTTLIELMISLTVLILLLAIAVPSFQSFIAGSALRSATNDLMNSIAQTRSLAIKTGRRATMCLSSSGTQCATTGNWEQGWIIFSDLSHTGATANVDAGDVINFKNSKTENNIIISGGNGFTQYISFSGDGQGKTNTGAFLAGKIRVCSTSSALEDTARARDLVMNYSGRVAIQTPIVASNCPAP